MKKIINKLSYLVLVFAACSSTKQTNHVENDIDVAEIAAIDTASVVVGNIKCDSLKMDGRVKGDLDVTNESLLLDNACVVGNVATGKINPAPGARISGNIVLRAAMEGIEDDFDFDIDFDFGGEN